MDISQANQYIAHLNRNATQRSVAFAEGRVMRWRIFGKGDPLVLVHGGHGSWLHWIRNIEALSRNHMLYVPDLPGFGDSDEAPAESCIQTLVDAIIVSLDTLLSGRRTLDLAGFSLGGVVSAHVAVQRGAVRRLALLGSPGSETPSRRKGELIRWRNAADDAAQNAALQHNLLTHMMYAQRNIDALAFRAYADSIKAARFRSRDRAHAIPLNEILKSYSKPVRFMYGEHDVICTPALAKHSLENTLARRECRVIQASGHWVQLERADTVNDELARWFATAAVTEQAQCLA